LGAVTNNGERNGTINHMEFINHIQGNEDTG